MADAVANLGRAWCSVILYDKPPNINVDLTKLRREAFVSVKFDGEESAKRECFGINHFMVPSLEQGKYQAGGITPQICYEPRHNYLKDGPQTPSETEDKFAIILTPITSWADDDISSLFRDKCKVVSDTSTEPNSSFKQDWQPEPDIRDITPSLYYESEYKKSGLGYQVGTAPTSPTEPSSGTLDTPVISYFVKQRQGAPGTWWAVKSNDIRVDGGAYWVTLFPTKAYTSGKSNQKHSFVAIRICRSEETTSTGTVKNDYVLYFDNKDNVSCLYNRNGKVVTFKSKLTQLSAALRSGTEIKVGFLIVCGRLCIYLDQFNYEFVHIENYNSSTGHYNPQEIQVGMDLYGTNCAVYGFGCSASVNVSPMTFFKKSWFILKSMDGETSYTGFKSPPETIDSVTEGTWSDGLFINWGMTKDQYTNNNSSQMYAAQFNKYTELDQFATTVLDTSVDAGVYSEINNAVHWWGTIKIIHVKVTGTTNFTDVTASTSPFWVCYMETDEFTGKDNTDATKYSSFSKYPIFYNAFAKIDQDVSGQQATEYSVSGSGDSTKDVTDSIISMEVSSEIDELRPSFLVRKATVVLYDHTGKNDYSKYLYKARGIRIWLKWDTSTTNPIITPTSGSSDDKWTEDLMFTGTAYGRSVSNSPGKVIVTLDCYDYFHIMDGYQIKNSPFYDGFELFSVIKDLSEQAGVSVVNKVDHSGGDTGVPFYFLGSGYSFDAPMFRFGATETVKSCIKRTLQAFPYYCGFSAKGKLEVYVVPGNFDFSMTATGWDSDVKATYYRGIENVSSEKPFKLILNDLTLTSSLSSSVKNSFYLRGVRRTEGTPLIRTGSISSSLTDADSIGYLGHISEINIDQPCLDSDAVVNEYMAKIKAMYSKPTYETEITTVGHIPHTGSSTANQIRPGQFVSIQQDTTPSTEKFRIRSINHFFSAEENKWMTKISLIAISYKTWSQLDGDAT